MSVIILALSLSLFINILIHKIKMPTIIGYIVTGTIIAYTFDFSGENAHLLKEIAEFGIVFLMFTIGLEFSIEKLKLLKYDVFVVGTLQILITGLITFFIAFDVFGFNINEAFVISMIIPLSSTAIVLKIFNDNGDINKKFGQKVVGILIMQDMAVIPILIILGLMISTDKDINQVLMNTAVSGFALLFIMFLFGKFLLEPFFDTTIQTNSEELFMLTVLFLVIGASYLSHVLGFSYSLGAFIAGMLISETKYKYKTESDLTPFRDLLLGIFFMTVGMQINLEIILNSIGTILVVLLLVFIIKFLVIYLLIFMKESKKIALKSAISLVQIGEFALVIIEMASHNSLIPYNDAQILIAAVVLSMILTPFILKLLPIISYKVFDNVTANEYEYAPVSKTLKNHIVVLGYGSFGKILSENLKAKGDIYAIVENNYESYKIGLEHNEPIIFGSFLDYHILDEVQINNAKNIILAINNIEKIKQVLSLLDLNGIDKDKIIIKVHSVFDKKEIEDEFDIHHIYVETKEVAESIVRHIYMETCSL